MRVLEIINTLDMGGAEALLCDLLPALKRLGAEVEVMCLSGRESLLERELLRQGIRIAHASQASPYSPLHILDVRKQVAKGNYDVVHSHLFPAQLWAFMGTRLAHANVPLVTTEHSTWNRRRRKLFRPLDRWMYAGYSSVACIGEATERALKAWLDDEHLPSKVIANGIVLERFQQAQRRWPADLGRSNPVTVICVASLTERKGHEVLLRAASLLPETEVLLVGDGPRRAELTRLSAELEMMNRVKFLGNRRDVPDLLARADIYVQPSQWEGFGIAAVEAMASGLPVIASDVPGLRDVVGETGLLFEPGSAPDLRRCIEQLIREPNLRLRYGAMAVARSAKFSIERTARAYLELYESACALKMQAQSSSMAERT